MSRPVDVDLTVPHGGWREIPMPAANLPLTMVRLDSADDVLTLYARFPAGFERPVPGGYAVYEEFLVLDGELMLDETLHTRGDLVYVPPLQVRTGMGSESGCTVLGWFGGMADFVEATDLRHSTRGGTRTTSVLAAEAGIVKQSEASRWVVTGGDGVGAGADDLVDLDLSRWRRGGASPDAGQAPLLVRTRG